MCVIHTHTWINAIKQRHWPLMQTCRRSLTKQHSIKRFWKDIMQSGCHKKKKKPTYGASAFIYPTSINPASSQRPFQRGQSSERHTAGHSWRHFRCRKTTGGIKKKKKTKTGKSGAIFFFAIIVGKFLISNTDCFPSVFTNSTRQ